MIRVKFRFGAANRKEMSLMSETSGLMDTLRQEGVSPDLLRAVEEYRAAHPLAEALRPRIPAPAFVYYGREVWEQALAALLCGENLLLAAGNSQYTCSPVVPHFFRQRTLPPPSGVPRGTSRSTSTWMQPPSSAWTPSRADR